MRRRIPLITTIVAVLLVIPAVAGAALVDEQRQGHQLVAQLRAGTKTCTDLSADDLDHIGEYVMFKALGSTTLHQAMNDSMTLMMGEQAETRMHQLLGARYGGCSLNGLGIAGSGSMMGGGGMMFGYYNTGGGWTAMMSSGDWSWMMSGAWQHMTRQDWQRLEKRLLGTTASANPGDAWSPVAIVAVTLTGLLVVALAILALIHRRPSRQPPATASSG